MSLFTLKSDLSKKIQKIQKDSEDDQEAAEDISSFLSNLLLIVVIVIIIYIFYVYNIIKGFEVCDLTLFTKIVLMVLFFSLSISNRILAIIVFVFYLVFAISGFRGKCEYGNMIPEILKNNQYVKV